MLENLEKEQKELKDDVSLLSFYSNNTINWIDAWGITSEDRYDIMKLFSDEIKKQEQKSKNQS